MEAVERIERGLQGQAEAAGLQPGLGRRGQFDSLDYETELDDTASHLGYLSHTGDGGGYSTDAGEPGTYTEEHLS